MVRFGPQVDTIRSFEVPFAKKAPDGAIEGEVIHVDRFGNLITNVRAEELGALAQANDFACLQVEIGSAHIPCISRTYSDVPPGALVAYVGSTDRLEIGVRNGSAAQYLGASVGFPVVVRRF